MKRKNKSLLIALVVLLVVAAFCGCAAEQSAYEKNNEEGYTVSVRFDANGGFFTTNTSVIVDSFRVADLPKNASGNAQVALLAPDDAARGNDAFAPSKSGCFLAGWYATRTEVQGEDGQVTYTYADRWDFDTDLLSVAADKTYDSQEPVMTLYAAWVPMFQVEFYNLSDGSLIDTYTYDPTTVETLNVPAWNVDTGAIDMYRFPTVSGHTFNCAYYDAEGTQSVEGETIAHTGVVDYATGVAQGSTMKLYLDYTEGEWYHIYTAEQFISNASVNGSYEIHADLDFDGKIWPTSLMYGNFSGTILGNGHTLRNIEVAQTNNSKINAGLFGCLTENAKLSDVTFDNVRFTIQAGTRVAGTSYGLFAGTISDTAALERVSVVSSTLAVDSDCYFGVTDYTIGLVCGMGDSSILEQAQISCEATGSAPETVHITVNDGQVTVEID